MKIVAEKFIRLDSTSRRRVLLAAIVVVAAGGLYKWVLGPFNNQLEAAERYNLTLDRTMRKAQVLDASLEEKKTKLDELVAASGRLRNELFTPDEAREFFAALPAMIRRAGCSVQSVSSVPEQQNGAQNQTKDGSGIVRKKAMVILMGGYGDIVRFFDRMQNDGRRVWIDSVRMDVSGAGKLRCQLTVTIYCIEKMEIALYE